MTNSSFSQTIFSEDWESGIGSWTVSNGLWEVGMPTVGPTSTHSGVNCAGTVLGGHCPPYSDTRLVSPEVTLPTGHVRLKFWHWFEINNYGKVEVTTDNGVNWQTVTTRNFSGGSTVWTQGIVDLSNYAGLTVRIGFHFASSSSSFTTTGWYIDDISIVAGSEILSNPEDFEIGVGDWSAENGLWEVGMPTVGPTSTHSGVNCAGTVLGGHCPPYSDTRLVSPLITITPLLGQQPQLNFWHWYEINGSGQVEFSVNGGPWQILVGYGGPYIGSNTNWLQVSIPLLNFIDSTIRIGFHFTSTSSGFTTSGWYIDDISISGIVNPVDPSLMAYYPFNGNANDESGNGNHGTVYGASLTTDRFGRQDSAYYFNGSTYINCGNPANNILDLGTDATINAWVKLDAGNSGGIIVGKDESSGGYNKYFFQLGGNGQLIFHINQPSSGNGAWMYSDIWELIPGRWYNISIVKEGLNYTFYVNGNSFGLATSWLEVPNVDAPFLIGAAEGFGYSGILDDISIYNRALTPAEIDSLYYIGGWPLTSFSLTVTINDGWNMVSVPGLNTPDQNVDTWWAYRDLGANVFKYSGGYQPVTETIPGTGYWMKHSGDRIYNTGDEWPIIHTTTHDSINASGGWNLIGGYESSSATATILTNPPGLQSGPVYKYLGGYQVASTLDPGYGYWIKLTGAGQIMIPEIFPKSTEAVESYNDEWGRIILTDATGISYTLYSVNGEVDLNQYELPPLPPAGMFDIRFSSGRIAEDIKSAIKTIDMSGVTYPLTVRVEGMDIRLMDETGKSLNVTLKSGEDIVISDATISKLRVTGELLPTVFSLEQNYPNPFNPSTMIEFSLPEDVDNVKLSIYNALGEKVAELVNTSLAAGKYSYQWNAGKVATGMYIYELRTDKFVSVKKMILIK